ncbi:ABC transporter permease [Gracilimonas sp.]|uniref:ABC transporter permease n=1 Tax=Gracilimonas sp. TaxID=1974203 RepID=UPI003D108D35
MLKNYLKIAFRNLFKNKVYSSINIFGLAVSMSVCLLIILFVFDQRSFDQLHERKHDIYRVVMDYTPSSEFSGTWYATSPADLASILEQNYSGIEKATHVRSSFGGETKYSDDTILRIDGFYTEPDFLDLFDFKLIQGDKETALDNPGSLVLKKSTAEKFFGNEASLGKTLTVLGDRTYTVTGIIDDGARTHFKFDALASLSSAQSSSSSADWTNHISYSYTYVLLDENIEKSKIESQLPAVIQNNFRKTDQSSIAGLELQPLTQINLGRVLSNEIGTVIPGIVVWFLGAFVLIIILITSFNYITLTISNSIKRGKEIGVRKVLGAERVNVIKQFITESLLISFIALIVGFFLLKFLIPEFNSLYIINQSNTQIETSIETNFSIMLAFLAFSLLMGVFAGIYPSLYLSKFKPASVLKGISDSGKVSSGLLRKTIIVFQFSFAIIFIISAIFLYRQFELMANTEYGFDDEYIVNIALQDVPYERFRQLIAMNPAVNEVAASSKIPALGSVSGMWVSSGSTPERIRANSFQVDEHYLEVMNIPLIAGRNFNPQFGSDPFSSVVLNKNAVEKLNLSSPEQAVGASVQVEQSRYKVIGVTENFISSSPLQNDDPALFLNNPNHFYYAVVKTSAGGISTFLPFLKEQWFELGSQYSLQYQIFDDQLQANPIVSVFSDFLKILSLITFFTILVSCLGLLGMAMNSTENRKKEIALRKVLGATVQNVTLLLTREYLVLMGIAIGLGGLTAFFLNNLWIKNISNSVEMDLRVFLIGFTGTILLVLCTISWQSIHAALVNPINSLRNE